MNALNFFFLRETIRELERIMKNLFDRKFRLSIIGLIVGQFFGILFFFVNDSREEELKKLIQKRKDNDKKKDTFTDRSVG